MGRERRPVTVYACGVRSPEFCGQLGGRALTSCRGEQPVNIRPLHDRIVVRRLEEGEQRIGGIIIPDAAKEKPLRGKVIAAGTGKATDDGKRVPLDVNAGDSILFGRYAGQEVKLDGEEYIIMKEDDVLAVIEGATPGKRAIKGQIEGGIKKKITKKSKIPTKRKTPTKGKKSKKSRKTT
jgi:chaperonin GroES